MEGKIALGVSMIVTYLQQLFFMSKKCQTSKTKIDTELGITLMSDHIPDVKLLYAMLMAGEANPSATAQHNAHASISACQLMRVPPGWFDGLGL